MAYVEYPVRITALTHEYKFKQVLCNFWLVLPNEPLNF